MRLLSKFSSTIILCLAAGHIACGQTASPPDEKTLWQIWKQHTENTNDHAGIIASGEDFIRTHPRDIFVPIIQGLIGWRQLQQGDTEAARAMFLKMEQARITPIQKAGATMAKGWLSQMDREEVRKALRKVYLKNVEYPATLEPLKSLPEKDRPPLTDRWGSPWDYRLVDFKALKNIKGQKYAIQSTMLGEYSDSKVALAMSYGERLQAKPGRLISSTPGRETVGFKVMEKGKEVPLVLGVGSTAGKIHFVHMGSRILILSDGLHWMILPRPAG